MIKITACGDGAIQKRLPKYYDGFNRIKDFIMQGDARFFNLETTVNKNCFANQLSGGTWLRTDKNVLADTLEFGFNMTTFANNHCIDFGHEGIIQTLDSLDEVGYVHAGMGRNLSEASAPKYLDTPNGRIALIGCSFSYKPGALAGEQSRRLIGRPGINGIRTSRKYIATKEQLKVFDEFAKASGINSDLERNVKEGYAPPPDKNEHHLDGMIFIEGEKEDIIDVLNEKDMNRITKNIREAVMQSDCVLVSFHSHIMYKYNLYEPAPCEVEFARRCIDAGASAVIGHGPHFIKPMEIYKDCPIFYSLGNIILHLENIEVAPEDFYEKFNLTSDSSLYELFKARTNNFTIGLQRQKVMMESVIPYFEIEDGKVTKIEIVPVDLGMGKSHSSIGWPVITNKNNVLERFREMSNAYGVKMKITGEKAQVIL